MILTKKAIMTWATPEDQYQPDLVQARKTYLESCVDSGVTDNVPTDVSPTVTVRNWLDQTSADGWKTWIENAAVTYSVNLQSVVIEDI